MLGSIGFAGRDQVGNVAVDKEFALIRAKNGGDVYPAITARNDHCTGALTFVRQAFVPGFILGKGGRLPAVEPLHKKIRQWFGVLHGRSFRSSFYSTLS